MKQETLNDLNGIYRNKYKLNRNIDLTRRIGPGTYPPDHDFDQVRIIYTKELQEKIEKLINKEQNMINTGKYIIGSYHSARGLSFSAKPAEHNTLQEARAEAERLARQNSGTTYIPVRIEGSVTVNSVVWK